MVVMLEVYEENYWKLHQLHDEWWCIECEHGPMAEKEDRCSRCGAKSGKVYNNDSDGWEEPEVEDEVEEIW